MKPLTVSLAAALLALALVGGAALAQTGPEFKLGFKALADQIPDVAGDPLEDEHWGANGDSLQMTSNGLMAWRKADNWTAFTDGSRTWVNGPFGVLERLNAERFEWEAQEVAADPVAPGEPAPAPPPPAVAEPAPPAAPAGQQAATMENVQRLLQQLQEVQQGADALDDLEWELAR